MKTFLTFHKSSPTLAIAILIVLSNLTFGAEEKLTVLDLNKPLRLDFSGSWEKDFRRSDNWRDELNRKMRMRQEAAQRQTSQSPRRNVVQPPISVGSINLPRSSGSTASVVELARLAEYVSRQTTLNITQTLDEIRITRRNDSTLVCGLGYEVIQTFANEFGVEACGWDQQQLVFQTTLPGELSIVHRFNVSSNRKELNLIITINSRNRESFSLVQAFTRYDAPAPDIQCDQTLSRGRVCSRTEGLR
ncbi:MAG: hypothetical protein CL926_07560 [Deltaproteobacteria bacterium]|jgi:hypothetical protein|nr:hypothetical protein [Deltaproteobacteria bacterium]|tara:strand:- start:9685 stop:10425 length:741 start_codon:yes stop_codon:yes gene_type:complete